MRGGAQPLHRTPRIAVEHEAKLSHGTQVVDIAAQCRRASGRSLLRVNRTVVTMRPTATPPAIYYICSCASLSL